MKPMPDLLKTPSIPQESALAVKNVYKEKYEMNEMYKCYNFDIKIPYPIVNFYTGCCR